MARLESAGERRGLAANISALAAGQLVTWTMSLVWTLIVPRALGPSGMGALVAGWSAAAVLSIVLGLGLRNYLTREIVVDPAEAASLLSTAVVLRIILMPVFVAATALYVTLGGFGKDQRLVILLAGGATLVTLLADPMQAAFQATTRMRYLAYSEVVSKSAQGLLGVALALVGFGAVGLTASWLAMAGVVFLLDLWWVRPTAHVTLRTSWVRIRSMVRGSVAYWAFGLFYMVYLWIDSVILSLMTPAKVVGWYGAPTKLFQTMLFVPIILSTAWLPRLVKAFETDPEKLRVVARPPLELVLVLSLPVCAAAEMVAGRAIPLLYGPSYHQAVPVFMILVLCLPLMAFGIMLNQVLIAAKRQKAWTWVMAGATVVNPLFNVALISLFQSRSGNGAVGAALSLVLTELLIAVVGMVVLGHKILNHSSLWRFCRAAIAAGAMLGAAKVVGAAGPAAAWSAGLAAFGLAAWMLRIASAEDLELVLAGFERIRQLIPWTRRREASGVGGALPGA